jgi:diguanylate cyclase (GGDEF)-like protein/putative nucleotidyltransferase with HDIG domain
VSDSLTPGLRKPAQSILTRWTCLIAAAYLVLYGSGKSLPMWQELAVLGALLTNLGVYAAAVRSGAWERLRWFMTASDIALVCVAVAVTGRATDDFFLFFFVVMMVAGISSQFGITMLWTSAVVLVYVGVMYSRLGDQLWHETEMLIRLPFLFGVGLFFGTVAYEARQEQKRYTRLTDVTQKMVHRYHQVASERDRTKALLDIGQLALSSARPEEVLEEINRTIQQTVRIDRVSTLIFNEGERHAYLAACTDGAERDVVLLLSLNHYPELQETLSTGEITELHPDEDSHLWQRVKRHLPKAAPYRSWLVVPIVQNSSVAGAFFLRDARPDFEFHEDELVFCKAAALMTAGYLQGCDLVEEMRRRSRLDGLTGLLNFLTFRQELDEHLGRALAEDKPLSLVMVDIDNLKIINDRHGHIVGNEVIQQVGFHLARALPMAHAVCRYGGDEFFALVPLSKPAAAERIERLLVALEALPEDLLPCDANVSIGIASAPDDGDLADTLMEAADRAMYLAKSEGGNRVHMASIADPEGQVFEAVIAVNARRLIPGETRAFRTVLDQLLRLEEQELDSTAVQQSLRALMGAVESKDSYTNTHSHEVSDLTLRLCQKLELSHRETLAVEMGALVHDIGKIGIPDEILQKPGALTTRERMRIEQHPEIGAQILRPLPALKDVVPLVLCHHEKWDGTGYPSGLSGEEIPVGAQVISLCDVWHALISDRAYRPAFPDEKARAIIREGTGKDWKPELVDAFLEVLEELDAERATQMRTSRRMQRGA